MKVLVTAASKHGATAEIVATIGEVLGVSRAWMPRLSLLRR